MKHKTIMTKYEFLLKLQALGELRTLVKNGFVSPHYLTWMEIYQYHLEHPKESLFEISKNFPVTKDAIYKVLHSLNEELI